MPRDGYREDIVYSFSDNGDGLHPAAGLVADVAGNFYGTTTNGSGYGTVFALVKTTTGFREQSLYEFKGGSDGANPVASLIVDSTGALYGTTSAGGDACGSGYCGTAFKLTPSNDGGYTETVLHRFGAAGDGLAPEAALLKDRSGALYGTTSGGGAFGFGTVFRLRPAYDAYEETILYSFHGTSDGGSPVAALIADASGALYGTTVSGGDVRCYRGNGCGTIFALLPSRHGYGARILYRFKSPTMDGAQPIAALLADDAGHFYGTTVNGGACEDDKFGCGTVFELTKHGEAYSERVIHRFTGGNDGKYPFSSLVADAKGRLFGTTAKGGGGAGGCQSADCGAVYEMLPARSGFTEHPVFAFRRMIQGDYLLGQVVIGPSHVLYGTAWQGGRNDDGVVDALIP